MRPFIIADNEDGRPVAYRIHDRRAGNCQRHALAFETSVAGDAWFKTEIIIMNQNKGLKSASLVANVSVDLNDLSFKSDAGVSVGPNICLHAHMDRTECDFAYIGNHHHVVDGAKPYRFLVHLREFTRVDASGKDHRIKRA